MKRILFVTVVTCLAIAGFTYFTSGSNAEAHEAHDGHDHEETADMDNILLTQKQINAVDLKMGEVERRELDTTVRANGQLVLRSHARGAVASLMGGVVKSINVKEGQRVAKGQVVATIENTDVMLLQREYYTACREVEMAKEEMLRQQTLQQNGAGVKKTMQQAQKDFKIAQANVMGIARQLQQMGINVVQVAKGHFTTAFPLRAPIAGTVGQLTASLGSYADMQTPLMMIRNNDAVEADLNVFEKDINKIKVGDKVHITLTNQTGVAVNGVVYGINQYFNDGTKAVAVHVKLNEMNGVRFLDGMYVQGQISTGSQQCNALPSKAIVTSDGKKYIFMLNKQPDKEGYSFSRHEVETGVEQEGYTEVALCKHFKKGKKIVTDNAFYLLSMTEDHGEHNH